MTLSWYERAQEFKSPRHVVVAFLLRSRETNAAKVQRLIDEAKELEQQLDKQAEQLEEQRQEIKRFEQRIGEVERQRDEAKRTLTLPDDPPLGTHGYGSRLVSLSINLARSVGFRGAERVLQIVFKWFGLVQIPPHGHRYETGCSGSESRN